MKLGYKTLYERRKIIFAILRMAEYKSSRIGIWRKPGYQIIMIDQYEKRFYTTTLASKQTSTLITQLNKVMRNETI